MTRISKRDHELLSILSIYTGKEIGQLLHEGIVSLIESDPRYQEVYRRSREMGKLFDDEDE